MAGLTWALIATRDILTSGGSFTVRGLGAEDIFGLVARRRKELESFYASVIAANGGNTELSLEAANVLAGTLIAKAPEIAAEIVAVASGPVASSDGAPTVPDAEAIAIARALPLPPKLAALEAIAELTFTSEMPPKKVVEIVVRMFAGLTREIGSLAASRNGSGKSASD